MFNLTGSEIIVILLLALVVLGPEKLPDAIRRFMQTYHELKKMGTGFQTELRQALDEPMREMRDTATLLQQAADPQRVAADAEADVTRRAQADAAAAAGFPTVPNVHVIDEQPTDAAHDSHGPTGGRINEIAAANARRSEPLRAVPVAHDLDHDDADEFEPGEFEGEFDDTDVVTDADATSEPAAHEPDSSDRDGRASA